MHRTDTKVAPLLALLVAVSGASARAEEPATQETLSELEARIAQLEAERAADEPADDVGSALAEWMRRVRIGGSADTGYFWGEGDSTFHEDTFQVWDARFFVDANLGEDVRIADRTAVRNVGFTFEWDLVRLGRLRNDVGELYVDFQGLGDSGWLNLQVGRAQIPVGESYLRYSRGYADKPFISNTVGGPWFWDEGLRFYGADSSDRFGYVASIMDAETAFNTDSNLDSQYTLKLYTNPTSWLHLSISGLYTGTIGSSNNPAQASLWLGETWARAYGLGTSVPNFVHGVAVPDGPNKIKETYLVGADAIFEWPDVGRLWLAYGTYQIHQAGTIYDRRLHYWTAELLVYGSAVTPALADVYVGVRADALGTYDHGEGYLLDIRRNGKLGYNMESMTNYSVVLGWKMLRYVTFRAEYTHQDIDMVRGVTPAIKADSRDNDYWGAEVGIHF